MSAVAAAVAAITVVWIQELLHKPVFSRLVTGHSGPEGLSVADAGQRESI